MRFIVLTFLLYSSSSRTLLIAVTKAVVKKSLIEIPNYFVWSLTSYTLKTLEVPHLIFPVIFFFPMVKEF